jgi:hypothetical protein
LVAKQLLFDVPGYVDLAKNMGSHLIKPSSIQKAEWWVLHVTCAKIVDKDFFQTLTMWSKKPLGEIGFQLCVFSAILSLKQLGPSAAFEVTKMVVSGTTGTTSKGTTGTAESMAGTTTDAIMVLKDGIRSGVALSFFRSWIPYWSDSTSIIKAWAATIEQESTENKQDKII